jgi:hypothetical protein
MDDSKNLVDSTEEGFESPPPARFFDEIASANAKPVQPIPTNRFAGWIQRAHDARQMLTARTKALALVLVGGLAIGTLGGTLLVKNGSSSPDPAPAVQESSAETTALPNATNEADQNGETHAAAQVSVMASESAGRSSKMRHRRIRVPVQRSQQAYRVGVIR